VCGLTVCAKRGVVVKGSQFLERLGQLKTMYIDKTGTLTTGTFEMTEVKLATPPSEDASTPRPALGVGALLRWVCAVESKSSHPLAFAIQKNAGAAVRVAARQCVVTNYEQIDGVGVRAMVDNVLVELGNEKLAEKKLWTLSDLKLYETAIRWETEIGATVVWVGINGKLGGILKAEDSLRPSAKDAIAKLQKSSIDVIILTGDNKGAAEMCAKNVGIDVHTNVFSSLTPNEKLNRITEEVQKQEKELVTRKKTIFRTSGRGTIAMVGDGINDAPALSAADVGVAMGVAGTAAAMETAPVALLTNDLSRLADTIYIGRRCVLKIRQNIFFSVTTKLVVLGLTFAGLAGLWQAVVVDVGSALVVIFNGMSILREAEKEDARRNKISHEMGVKFAEEEKEKQKLLAERQQVHSHGHSQQVHSHGHSHAHDHSCCDHDKEEGKKTVPPSCCAAAVTVTTIQRQNQALR
jgi:Cd2+/Zn2+-exporting ATPase